MAEPLGLDGDRAEVFKGFFEADQEAAPPATDDVIVTGDLAHWGEDAAYENLASVLARLNAPTILLMGNHDKRDPFGRPAVALQRINQRQRLPLDEDAEGRPPVIRIERRESQNAHRH